MFKRFRNRRVTPEVRKSFRETSLAVSDFIWPVFIRPGKDVCEAVASMPGVHRYSADRLLPELKRLSSLGLKSILVFGVPIEKGISGSYSREGLVQTTVRMIRDAVPSLEVITDVCLCSYTEDGHCHVGDNDETCEILAQVALSHAEAGTHRVAPSDMMDGRVYTIRQALNASGFKHIPILSYAAKYASHYYGPFRDAAECTPQKGDRRTYQMDPPNALEALDEIRADLEEGADSVIIKPALAYLDIISLARAAFNVPIAAYNVSGEYTMLMEMVNRGLAREAIIPETLLAMKRAGANKIISYFTPKILEAPDVLESY